MSETTYYAAFRDDRLLEGTISKKEIETDNAAYQQAYDDAVDDLCDQHRFNANTDDTEVDNYIDLKWYYEVQKLTKAELIEAIKNGQSDYYDFDDFDFATLD